MSRRSLLAFLRGVASRIFSRRDCPAAPPWAPSSTPWTAA